MFQTKLEPMGERYGEDHSTEAQSNSSNFPAVEHVTSRNSELPGNTQAEWPRRL